MKRILVLLFLLALIPIACADPTADSLSVSSASGDLGDTSVSVLVNITNTAEGPIQGIAFDVIYDHGALELVKARRGSDLPTDDGDPAWTIKLGNNQQRVTMYTDDQEFALSDGTTGNIAELQFNVNATANPGDYPIGLFATVSDTYGTVGIVPTINGTLTITVGTPGDLNGDGTITSADAVIVLQMAVRGEYDALADVNGDDSVTSLDALMIMQVAAGRITI